MVVPTIGGLLALSCSMHRPAEAQTQAPQRPVATWTEAAVSTGLVAVGFALDHTARDWSQRHRSTTSNAFAHVGNGFGDKFLVFPGLGVAMLAAKAGHSDQTFDTFWEMTQSAALAAAGAEVIKVLFGRARPPEQPNNHAYFRPLVLRDHSFPSGHTATAFALATAAAAGTKSKALHPVYFGVAALTAWSRVNNDRHWLSDVIGGAAVGILVGRFVTRGHGIGLDSPTPVKVGLSLRF